MASDTSRHRAHRKARANRVGSAVVARGCISHEAGPTRSLGSAAGKTLPPWQERGAAPAARMAGPRAGGGPGPRPSPPYPQPHTTLGGTRSPADYMWHAVCAMAWPCRVCSRAPFVEISHGQATTNGQGRREGGVQGPARRADGPGEQEGGRERSLPGCSEAGREEEVGPAGPGPRRRPAPQAQGVSSCACLRAGQLV